MSLSHRFTQNTLILMLFILGLASCQNSGVNKYARGSEKLFETFFSGDDGIQYFIKPFELAENEEMKMNCDITFRYKKELKDSALFNVSILAPYNIKDLDAVKMSNGHAEMHSGHSELLFNELTNKGYISRHSVKFALAEVREMFRHPKWKVEVDSKHGKEILHSKAKSDKKIQQLNAGLFVLMD